VREKEDSVDARFWRVFQRTLGIRISRGNVAVRDLEEWDSLRHVELIFELEEEFGLSVSPAEIAELYSDTDTILAYLLNHSGEQ
jgi:acyl carrier protein